ncbi:MAG: class I SAM-dependent methyltransferase [Neisseriaceae bacterium]|nr:class I SAM-dependent methyltransferase [Neisseriaceae bacterium]
MHYFESLTNRIKKNLKPLRKWSEKNQFEAFRIYDRDIPQFPFMIDIYGQELHIQEYDTGWIMPEDEYIAWLSGVKNAVSTATQYPIKNFHFKRRAKQKGKSQYEKQANRGREYAVREGENFFLVNLEEYIDTGLFLDHRPMRLYVGEHSKGKRILNLFCYTGSFTVHAAKGGASYSESVDLTSTYIEWARRNFMLNEMDLNAHHLMKQDVFMYLVEAIQHNKKFDLIVLDPPSFSNSKKMLETLDIQKDHERLINQTMQLLNPDGILIFSNNFRNFQLSDQLTGQHKVENKTNMSIPIDFRNKKIHQCWWISHR